MTTTKVRAIGGVLRSSPPPHLLSPSEGALLYGLGPDGGKGQPCQASGRGSKWHTYALKYTNTSEPKQSESGIPCPSLHILQSYLRVREYSSKLSFTPQALGLSPVVYLGVGIAVGPDFLWCHRIFQFLQNCS